jgi:hypothetical protein
MKDYSKMDKVIDKIFEFVESPFFFKASMLIMAFFATYLFVNVLKVIF